MPDGFGVAPGRPRCLRVFISHRHDHHRTIYEDALSKLREYFGEIQDLSIPKEKVLTGPRKGDLPAFQVQSEIAARIYESDIFIAPSSVSMGISEWTSYEIECAAFAYSQPILFVDEPGQQRNAALVTYVKDHVEKCGTTSIGVDGGNITQAVIGLVGTRVVKSQPPPDRSAKDWLTARTPDAEALTRVREEFRYLPHDGAEDVRHNRQVRRRRRA